jgi:hypothetical protein
MAGPLINSSYVVCLLAATAMLAQSTAPRGDSESAAQHQRTLPRFPVPV